MKQVMPFIVIVILIGTVMYVMQDDYEGPDYADIKTDVEIPGWTITYYINDIAHDEPMHGVEAERTEDNGDFDTMKSLELFLVSSEGSFYIQDLEVEDFDGTVRHEEVCSGCGQDEHINGRVMINWNDQTNTHMEYETFAIEIND
ncbi:hypothetical protein [Salisediminibacterium halotolerans]|uniref:Uncharacterized protein n=1 Tax=Salisediminibacterium halotolerans TaxID=517425 RepID=A0A1H9WWP6_9BACI|nr:hypothetical protein [Salisediminibacterium haloalkalitolerans]SES38244.1 hypothetical protein SAMN05444126_1534 [Salisediminibacterium haloalkalitolerans]